MKQIKELMVYKDGALIPSKLFYDIDDSSVQLVFEGFDSGIIKSEIIYYAMQNLHSVLDGDEIKLLCNCFRYDIFPSRMALSMGQGVKAYKIILGKQAKELVDIFDSTSEIEAIVTVEEQQRFIRKWGESLGAKF